jgi:hypothetical protein
MHSFSQKQFHAFQANATALGGRLLEPFGRIIPPLAPTSLPAVGGFATARSGAFNLDEIVSVSSAYTLVTGRAVPEEGGYATLATAVVENFNLLDVVAADRIVAQVSVTTSRDDVTPQRISFGGSRFEGLRVAGGALTPRANADLWSPTAESGDKGWPSGWPGFRRAVSAQAESLVSLFGQHPNKEAADWARRRHGWEGGEAALDGRGTYSVFEGFEETNLPGAYGHILEIPHFGRIYFGEVFMSPNSLEFVSIRADLGCAVGGPVTGPSTDISGGKGKHNP